MEPITAAATAGRPPLHDAPLQAAPVTIITSVTGQPVRENLEQYIAGIFHASYGARVTEFLPLLCALQQAGDICAALGLRYAAHGPLFCESYLDGTVTDHVEALHGSPCERRQLLELGNLVSTRPGASALLYLLVVTATHQAGIPYLIFTANRAVRASIRRSGFTPVMVAPARRERVANAATDWGTYYAGDPVVMIGDMALTRLQARSQPRMRRLLQRYHLQVAELAASIRDYLA